MKLRRNRSRTPGLEAQVEQLAQRVRDIEAHAADAVTARAAQQQALEGLEARISQRELAASCSAATSARRSAGWEA
jgi:hypothetical protein